MKTLALISLLFLAGCMSVGNKINHEYANNIQKGVTTEQEVLTNMGPPMSTAINSDGLKILTYMHVKTDVHGATFIPIVGMFAGGADSTTTTVVIQIDNETGIVKDWTYSTATATSKNGGR